MWIFMPLYINPCTYVGKTNFQYISPEKGKAMGGISKTQNFSYYAEHRKGKCAISEFC